MSEFKNFVTLEKADIKLKHAIIYGLRGFDTLNDTLTDIWTPDVIHNQLRGVLAGIGMTRPLVELGIGIRDIVAVPVAEIRKDGFKVRSVQKGAIKALSTTSSGFARLIAKVAIGTGTRLQDIEDMLSPAQHPLSNQALSNVEEEYEQAPPRAVSNYADQPLGVLQGLHSARRYLERDLTTARDAIIAVQGDFMASGTAAGAAKAVMRHAPTILLQPVIGVSRAVGQTFKGVGNQVDREHIKMSEDVSLSFPFPLCARPPHFLVRPLVCAIGEAFSERAERLTFVVTKIEIQTSLMLGLATGLPKPSQTTGGSNPKTLAWSDPKERRPSAFS
jgi:autophagy-related protein 2